MRSHWGHNHSSATSAEAKGTLRGNARYSRGRLATTLIMCAPSAMLSTITTTIDAITIGALALVSDRGQLTISTLEQVRAALSHDAAEMAISTIDDMMTRFCCLTLVALCATRVYMYSASECTVCDIRIMRGTCNTINFLESPYRP